MNIIDYILKTNKEALVFDDSGNLYIYFDKIKSDEIYKIQDALSYCVNFDNSQ